MEPSKNKGKRCGPHIQRPHDSGPIYYMRLLLNYVKGAKCFSDIRTINGKVYNSYKDACDSLGLLFDDAEYISGIIEVSQWQTAKLLRHMFAMLLLSKSMSKPEHLWEQTWKLMSDDILYDHRRKLHNPGSLTTILFIS